jgi:hypothetical protein
LMNVSMPLECLGAQNYVDYNDDTYSFLTDEEQDVITDIRNTTVDSAAIVASIGQMIFSEIYPTKKYKYNKYDFAYDQYIDDILVSTATGGVRLRFITVANDYYDAPEAKYIMDSQIGNETIVLLSNTVKYYEELEAAAKMRKYANQKNAAHLPDNIQDIIRKCQTQAQAFEDSAVKQIEKAIVDGTFFICGQKVVIKFCDARSKLDEALKQLIECVYPKLNLLTMFSENDADILHVLNGESEQVSFAGLGANNEFAINEVSQWLEERFISHIPISMGDVQRRYQAPPYGWREVDIATVVASLIVTQKIEIRYGDAVVGKDDRNLVGFLRKRSEIEKANVSRRIAPSKELMCKSIVFLRNWLGQMDIPEDHDDHLNFVKDTLETKLAHYERLIDKYKLYHYPQKELVIAARDLIKSMLSHKQNNVALLTDMIAKQDELRDVSRNMEEVETFFKSQRTIFDAARQLHNDLHSERNYFTTAPDITEKIIELSNILEMEKPYTRIKDLPDLMQDAKTAYGKLLVQKKEEVLGIITQCMGDVHTLAGVASRADGEVKKSDIRFTEYKQKVADATSLSELDTMIIQLLNYKDQVCKRSETILYEGSTQSRKVGEQPKQKKIVQIRRYDVFPVKRLSSQEDIEHYLDGIRKKLNDTLEGNDSIQIN